MIRKTLLVGALLAALPAAAFAEGFNWNATLASDYLYRGVDQNDDKPALQLGAGYDFGNGFYIGAWGSNVDFGDSTDIEIDTFVGWAGDVADGTTLDVQLVRYNYLNQPSDTSYEYNELIGTLSFAEQYDITLGYTNNYFNEGDRSLFVALGSSFDVGNEFSLDTGIGYTAVDGPYENYVDYRIGLSRAFGPATFGLGYVGTNGAAERNFDADATENKILLTIDFEG